ncbi:hypothetical protein ACERII_09900 [Evansella sp. AB-rgal1]|uniref:hypothetical protein n=1 Tax=Evansella sp. AB-rgal1 TaxID=3242696 RepID=UPI00359EA95D
MVTNVIVALLLVLGLGLLAYVKLGEKNRELQELLKKGNEDNTRIIENQQAILEELKKWNGK